MSLLIFSRSPYLMTLGTNTIRHPMRQFLALVVHNGVRGAWTLVSLLLGVGAIGLVSWAVSSPALAVFVAAVGWLYLVLLIGAYRAWLAAARFVPDIGFEAQRRADTLRSFLLSRERTPELVHHYHAMMAQDALTDYDRLAAAGALDESATRQMVGGPRSIQDVEAILMIFQEAAERASRA